MNKYLITFTPLESYFFGGERTFGFGSNTVRNAPYYIVSENVPSQPTLFGTLRYIILSQNAPLYGQQNAGDAAKLVGVESFSFKKALAQNHSESNGIKKQTFGRINKISPLFLVKDEVWYIPTPLDHNPGDKDSPNKIYTPFTMEDANVKFGDGFSFYPTDYKAKDGYGGGYLSLSNDKSVISDSEIFLPCERTGINSHRTEDTSAGIKDDSSFFKKLRKRLANGFSFAIIAELQDDLKTETTVVFMGQDKSPFLCTITETDKDLIDASKAVLNGSGNISRKYALSDILPTDAFFNGNGFSYYIANTKVLRNLESKVDANNAFDRYAKSDKLYKLIRAGSIFITDHDFCTNKALEQIGMNVLIDIS